MSGFTERTPSIIAGEINRIKGQMKKFLFIDAMEIGRRLKEAKSIIPHDEWGRWVNEFVYYTERTAEIFMILYDGYRDQESSFTIDGDHIQIYSNSLAQKLSKLTASQALVLLGLPNKDRTKFLGAMDVEGMNVNELKRVIDQWKLVQQEVGKVIAERDQARQDSEELRKELDIEKGNSAQ